MENKENFDLDAYYKSLEEDDNVKEYEKKSSEIDSEYKPQQNEDDDLGALESLILEGEAAVGFTRNQKK